MKRHISPHSEGQEPDKAAASEPVTRELRLVPVEKNGAVRCEWSIPAEISEHFPLSALWYQKVGYEPPWIGYVAFDGGRCVGSCGFKTAPKNGEVEIAYGTVRELRNKGYATAMARALSQIARELEPRMVITAQTLPQTNASTSVLKKLGFTYAGDVQHPEDGLVWEWKLAAPLGFETVEKA